MKKEQRLIIKLLDYLASRHNQMSFVYGDDEFGQHFIEVTPTPMFDDDDKYIMDEVKIKNEFYDKYPDQGLVFISNHPILKVENVIYRTKAISAKSFSKPNALPPKSFWGSLSRTLGF